MILLQEKNEVILFLKLDYAKIEKPIKTIRDVSNIGHYGTGDVEVTISNLEELELAKPLIEEFYSNS